MQKVLFTTLILFTIAFIMSGLLAYFGTRLAVRQDKRIDVITKKLTGANCGACGYAGCSAYAKELVQGKATLADCPSTPIESKNEIAELLGLEESGEETKIIVTCAGGHDCKNKYSYQGYGDCRSMNLLSSGSKACEVGCMGMGSCVDSCHNHAIEMGKDAYPILKYQYCVNCGLCIKACPKQLLKRIPKTAKVYVACSNHSKGVEVKKTCSKGCLACGLCQKLCPEQAIKIVNNLAEIDYNLCTGCCKCAEKCPSKSIKIC